MCHLLFTQEIKVDRCVKGNYSYKTKLAFGHVSIVCLLQYTSGDFVEEQ